MFLRAMFTPSTRCSMLRYREMASALSGRRHGTRLVIPGSRLQSTRGVEHRRRAVRSSSGCWCLVMITTRAAMTLS
jgi:hypothetical protein